MLSSPNRNTSPVSRASGAVLLIALLLAVASCSTSTIHDPLLLRGSGSYILGADVSWVPENEDPNSPIGGRVWSDGGVTKDVFEILRDHGFDYIRLRLFNDPRAESGYSAQGYCDIEHTKALALRIKEAGLGLMLAFHYSDTWADPGKQSKPAAWKDLHGDELVTTLGDYTRSTLRDLAAQGTLPSIVAIGNEVTHGMLWEDGRAEKDWPYFARLLKEAYKAVKDINPDILVAIQIERGQRLSLTKWFAEQLAKYDVPYDVLAISCYAPDPEALTANLFYFTKTHGKPVILSEYSDPKRQLNEAIYSLPSGMGLGTIVWEPTVARRRASPLFDDSGAALPAIKLYDDLRKRFTAPRAWPGMSRPADDARAIAKWEAARAKLPSCWIVGDATVRTDTDQWQGWGEVISEHFDDSRINVRNRAVHGLTSRSYIAAGKWKEVLDLTKPGDYVSIQFGYHDGGPIGGLRNPDRGVLPGTGDETTQYVDERTKETVTVHTFGWYLSRYVTDARAKGLNVILITPLPRDEWNDDGSLVNAAHQYAEWTIEIGSQLNVPVLDLNAIIARHWSDMGKEKVSATFFTGKEHGLTTPQGADFTASCLAQALLRTEAFSLKRYLKN